jgi:hypothetical protein
MIKLAIIGILVLIVITLAVGYYLELREEKRCIDSLYFNFSNLQDEYYDNMEKLQEVLTVYHDLLNDYQIPMIAPVEFTEWMEAGKPTVNNDDW